MRLIEKLRDDNKFAWLITLAGILLMIVSANGGSVNDEKVDSKTI